MALVSTKKMFADAYAGGYAIGAFNINNMEIIQGIVDAALETNSPVMLQVSSGALKYARPTYLKKLVEIGVLEQHQLGREQLFLHPKLVKLVTQDNNEFELY